MYIGYFSLHFPFLFNNVTCWTCIKRIPFRAKIMYIAHNSVSMACDRNMCILVMVWSQYHSPSKDAVLLLPNACCPSLFSVFSELMMGERLKVNDMKIIMLIIKQKHLVLKLVIVRHALFHTTIFISITTYEFDWSS